MAGSVMGSLIFLAIIIGIIYCCVKGCPCCENPNHTVITTPGTLKSCLTTILYITIHYLKPIYITSIVILLGYVSHVHQPPPVHISYQNAPPQMQPPPYGAQNCNPMYPPQHGHHQEYQHNVQPAPAYNPNY